jgi:nicotinate-nucleotide adenylyltransferase
LSWCGRSSALKAGLLGGTFDPVHMGHLLLAEHAREALALDQVLFVPAGEPWRKGHREITPAEHRLAMLRLAVAGNDALGITDIELRREGPSYTADTLEALAGERLDDEFYFILGADALADLPHWRDPERIVRHATLAVAPREEDEVELGWLAERGLASRVVTFAFPRIDVSSTDVRRRAAAGLSVRYMVPDGVAAYIVAQGLYR